MDTHSLLILGHIIGTILGVGGATMIEIHLNKALQDGKMDTTDREFLGSDFLVTRIGMFIGFVTGMGFIVEYWMHDQLFRLDSGVFWAKMLIFLIIILNAYLLAKHKVGLYWGSAFSFVSWWTVMILGSFLTSNVKIIPADTLLSFVTIMGVYAVTIIIAAFVLHKIRGYLKERYARAHPATGTEA